MRVFWRILQIFVFAALFGAAAYVWRDYLPFWAGQAQRESIPDPDDAVVARVSAEGVPPFEITRKQVIVQRVLMHDPDIAPPTNKQALEALVRNRLLEMEARGRGVAFSDKEAAAIARRHAEQYAQGVLPDYEEVRGIIEALHIDPPTYWKEIAPERYRTAMSMYRLRQVVRGELASRLPPGNEQKLDMLYDSWVRSVQARARIEVLDRSFVDAPNPETP